MKKILFQLLLIALLLSGCYQGAETGAATMQQTTEGEATMQSNNQLTPSQLIEFADLQEGQYSEELLERFIRYYDISAQNVQALNIELLLSEFAKMESTVDVRSIFSEETSDVTTELAKDIVAIAFYENINTNTYCVYYDFVANLRYRADDMGLFANLLQVVPEKLTSDEAKNLRETVIRAGVLQWENTTALRTDIADPQSMCMAIRFSDGRVYRTEASGILAKCGLPQYEALRDLLLGNE